MTTTFAAAAAGVPELRLTFAYDSMSRRIQKKVELKVSGQWQIRNDVRFIYDGWNLMAEVEYHAAAADAPKTGVATATQAFLRRTYMWGPDLSGTMDGAGGVGGLLMVTRHERGTRAAESYWATADMNGNVIGLVSTTTPGRVAVYDYDAFGKLVRVNEPEEGLNPIRFSSKYVDAETGLAYYGYRYYSPELGRWISRDPIEEEGGLNLYGMVNNNPVSRVDVLGLRVGLLIGYDIKIFTTRRTRGALSNFLSLFVSSHVRPDLTVSGSIKACDDEHLHIVVVSERGDANSMLNSNGPLVYAGADTIKGRKYPIGAPDEHFRVKNNPDMKGIWLWHFGGNTSYLTGEGNRMAGNPQVEAKILVKPGEWKVGGKVDVYIEDYESQLTWRRTIDIE